MKTGSKMSINNKLVCGNRSSHISFITFFCTVRLASLYRKKMKTDITIDDQDYQ